MEEHTNEEGAPSFGGSDKEEEQKQHSGPCTEEEEHSFSGAEEEEEEHSFSGAEEEEHPGSGAEDTVPPWEPDAESINEKGWFASYFMDAPDKNLGVHKWLHYLPIYEKHLARFRGKSPVILEVGVAKGGSIEMWNRYFKNDCQIFGVDLMRKCQVLQGMFSNVTIVRGDQADPLFWETFKAQHPKVDILLEDGGHKMHQQIRTFECMYDHVQDDGVYLCEDLCTSYRPEYGGGFLKPDTFVEYAKGLVDSLNAHHVRASSNRDHNDFPLDFRHATASVTFYDGVVVFEKKRDTSVPEGQLRGGRSQCLWCNRLLVPGEPPHEKSECQSWLREEFP